MQCKARQHFTFDSQNHCPATLPRAPTAVLTVTITIITGNSTLTNITSTAAKKRVLDKGSATQSSHKTRNKRTASRKSVQKLPRNLSHNKVHTKYPSSRQQHPQGHAIAHFTSDSLPETSDPAISYDSAKLVTVVYKSFPHEPQVMTGTGVNCVEQQINHSVFLTRISKEVNDAKARSPEKRRNVH